MSKVFTADDARRNYEANSADRTPSAAERRMRCCVEPMREAILARIEKVSAKKRSLTLELPGHADAPRGREEAVGPHDRPSRNGRALLTKFGAPLEALGGDKAVFSCDELTWLLRALGRELAKEPYKFKTRHVPSKGDSGGRIGGTVYYSDETLTIKW